MADRLVRHIIEHLKAHKGFVLFAAPEADLVEGWFSKGMPQQYAPSKPEQQKLQGSQFVMQAFDVSKAPRIINQLDCHIIHLPINELMPQQIATRIDPPEDGASGYAQLVSQAITAIDQGAFQKVVLSRAHHIALDPYHWPTLLTQLMLSDQQAFRYVWYHPEEGLWLGATPELLLSGTGRSYQTMALAGTQWNSKPEHHLWTDKEGEEHQWVIDDISHRLSGISNEVQIGQTQTHQAGALQHLKTPISGTLKKHISFAEAVAELHPTPAVCGYPRHQARRFIQQYEGYDRGFYTGFLGWQDPGSNKAQFYVNLRCMQLSEHTATLFAGGGITQDSDPQREFEETQKKLGTMGAVIAPFFKSRP